jgi:hypothetical protein
LALRHRSTIRGWNVFFRRPITEADIDQELHGSR